MKSTIKIFVVFVFFSFLIVSCGGEEATLPDEEAVTDEVTDENSDEDVVENNDETTDETEIDEEVDSDIDNQENVYKELESFEDCKNSSCSEICFLVWDDESAKSGNWCEKKTNNNINCDDSGRVSFKLFIDNFEKCFFSVPENPFAIKEDIVAEGYEMPLKNLSYSNSAKQFNFFFKEEKELRIEGFAECYDAQEDRDRCEDFGLEVIVVEGVETFFGGSFNFIFVI